MQSGGMDYSEKRDFIRMTVDCQVDFTIVDAMEEATGRAVNLSGRGLLFQTDREIPIGTRLEVNVRSENNRVQPLNAQVEVVRVEVLEPGSLYEIGGLFIEVAS